MRNREILLLFLSCLPLILEGQESDRGNISHQIYQDAISAYNQRQYQGAQALFEQIAADADYLQRANGEYYAANAAVRLNQVGADKLMTRFVARYPLSVRRNAAYLDVADFYFDSGKYPNAVTWYRKADLTGLFGKNRERYYFRMGYGLYATDKQEEARRYLQRVSNSKEFGSQAKYYLGFSAYQQDDYEQASRQFDQITDQKLLQEKLAYFQADMNFKLGNFEEAINQAKKQLPKSDTQEISELNKIIGESYFNLKQYAEAIPYLEAYEGKAGRWSNTDFYLLGFAYYQQGVYSQAIGQFNKIVNGNDFVAQNAYYHLGVCYLNSDKKQEALNAFRNAASMDFNEQIRKDALYNYALLSYEIGNPFEPVQDVLSRWLNRYPNEPRNSKLKSLLVDSYITARNFAAALDLAQANRSAIDDVTYQKVLYYRGVELYLADNYKASASLFQSAAAINANARITALSVYWKAESDYAMRLFEQALAGFLQFKNIPEAITIPEYSGLWYQIGYAQFNLKRYNEAISAFKNYCEISGAPNFTDASLRLGDSYFAGSRYREAIVAYERAKAANSAQKDFADYQIALCLGFLGEDVQKIEILKSFERNYPNSPLADEAMLELGNTYLDRGKDDLALQAYDRLRSQFPKSPGAVSGAMRRGLIYYNRGENQTALNIFKEIAEQYPDNPESVQAVASAKRAAVELGQVAEFAAWVSGLNFIEVSAGELEAAAYEAAARQLVAGNSKAARKNYENYLQQFPTGLNNIAVRFELARICYAAGENQTALDYFKPVAASGSGEMAEQALTRICEILILQDAYTEAIPYLRQLESTANIAQNRIFAQSNLMKGYYQQQDYDQGLQYAQRVLESPDLDQRIRSDAYLVMARTAWEKGDSLKAKSAYASLLSQSFGEATAEALYFDAYFKQQSNAPEESNASVQRLLQEYGSYREWGGKGLLLMAQNFSVLDDAFQATYILENIISNFQDYPELVERAQSELRDLKVKEARRNTDVNPEGN